MSSIHEFNSKLPHGTNRCKCSGCGEYFGGVRAFELHRTGTYPDRVCLPPSCASNGHKRPLLRLNDLGYWVHVDKPVRLHKPVVQTMEAQTPLHLDFAGAA